MIIHRPVSPSPIRQSTEEAVRNGMIYLLSTIWSYLSTASRSSSASPLPIQLFAERVIFPRRRKGPCSTLCTCACILLVYQYHMLPVRQIRWV